MNTEHKRLLAVNRFKHLNAGADHDLDNLTKLIGQICETPVALVTLIDESNQWLKAKYGLDLECDKREESFCTHTIKQEDLLTVTDALLDDRFKDLPLVTGDPNIRFYAGMPLITYDGYAVGALCVADVVPRQLTAMQQTALQTLAKQVLNILELNWSLKTLSVEFEECQSQKHEIETYAHKLNAVFNSTKDIHVLLGRNIEVLAFNKPAANYVLAYYRAPLEVGKSLLSFLSPAGAKRLMVYFNSTLSGVKHHTEWKYKLNNDWRWMDVAFTPISSDLGEKIGVAINATDITLTKLHADQVDTQNAALQRIATFQSHELRRPVASLLGIIELIKDEALLSNSPYMTMMSSAIDELDQKIRGIVKDAETTIYGNTP